MKYICVIYYIYIYIKDVYDITYMYITYNSDGLARGPHLRLRNTRVIQ